MKLSEATLGTQVVIHNIGGERAFRRRLMELGLVRGARVELVSVAPLGDPIELLVRGCSLSIRRAEASAVEVGERQVAPANLPTPVMSPMAAESLSCSSCARGTP